MSFSLLRFRDSSHDFFYLVKLFVCQRAKIHLQSCDEFEVTLPALGLPVNSVAEIVFGENIFTVKFSR
jgi:hypothetical protein